MGVNYDYFPNGKLPSMKEIREIVLENPIAWQRPYLAYMGYHNPEYLNTKLTFGEK